MLGFVSANGYSKCDERMRKNADDLESRITYGPLTPRRQATVVTVNGLDLEPGYSRTTSDHGRLTRLHTPEATCKAEGFEH
jgi:hypothetical protein